MNAFAIMQSLKSCNSLTNSNEDLLMVLLMWVLFLWGILLYWICCRCSIDSVTPCLLLDVMTFAMMFVFFVGARLSLLYTLEHQISKSKKGKQIKLQDSETVHSNVDENRKENLTSNRNETRKPMIKYNENKNNISHVIDPCRITIYQFGSMKSIDGIICEYFSFKDILKYRLINKYYNNLICDRMDDVIWNDICDSLQFIPMKMKEKEKIIINNNRKAKKTSEIFCYACKDNGNKIDSLLKIVAKNSLFKSNAQTKKKEKNEFVNKLNDKCAHFLKRWQNVKITDESMFIRDMNYNISVGVMNCKLNFLKDITPDIYAPSNKTCHILKFVQLIDSIICNINKYNEKLWTNERNFYIYYPKCEQLYDDLFDIFYYFGWYLGNEEKHEYNKNEACYFYESILIWITVRFLDK